MAKLQGNIFMKTAVHAVKVTYQMRSTLACITLHDIT